MKAIGWLVGVLGLGFFGLLTAAGCESGVVCNAMLPSCELAVELEHSGWEPGEYAFEIDVKGKVHRCTATLPDVQAKTLECTGTDWIAGRRLLHWDSGFPTSLAFQGSPKSAEVRIFYEGREVASEDYEPHYKVTEPNGEGCYDCRNATVTLAF